MNGTHGRRLSRKRLMGRQVLSAGNPDDAGRTFDIPGLPVHRMIALISTWSAAGCRKWKGHDIAYEID